MEIGRKGERAKEKEKRKCGEREEKRGEGQPPFRTKILATALRVQN